MDTTRDTFAGAGYSLTVLACAAKVFPTFALAVILLKAATMLTVWDALDTRSPGVHTEIIFWAHMVGCFIKASAWPMITRIDHGRLCVAVWKLAT